MNPPQAEQVTLYYREGSSDKVYQCSIEPTGEHFVVNFAFGRRGTTLSTGTKTSSPVDHGTAKKMFEKLVREKTAKGYTPGEQGIPYQHTDKEQRYSGIVPQLLNPIDEAEANRLLNDSGWCMQEKHDGRRVLLMKVGPVISGVNKKGLTIGLPSTIMQSGKGIEGDYILDGEAVGDTLYVFDLLTLNGENLESQPYRTRLLALMNLIAANLARHIQLVHTAFNPKDKALLLGDLRTEEKEGVVFKRLDAPYTPGRPNSGGSQLKHKFYATCSAVVTGINAQRSVEIRLLDQDGWQPAGNVTIPPNQLIPVVGTVVEVRYLYALRESGCLYQPVYLGERNDVEKQECLVSQLKYKPTDKE
ncbi:MAG: WGR domain-containing protein [Verrucomicrobia bacterium]|nr:WGR domain-containing protein [Verrucomicrobiota bacterium]